MDREEYMRAFDEVEHDFVAAVEELGVPFEACESFSRARRREAALACGAACENNDASLWLNWLSPACKACRTGERTATFFISLACTKNCYFCFNPNQEDYECFRTHKRDAVGELRRAAAEGARLDCIALTGGEPLLFPGDTLDFMRTARELYPSTHLRLYTSGDLLDDALLVQLAEAGLDEIRFSVKPRESAGDQEGLLTLIGRAVGVIPDVMVEMPVIPGGLDDMKRLLLRLDSMGVRGINLLEFCFPLNNAQEYTRRGFALRRKPFVPLYNYWYAGGLPVAGSEGECLELLEFAADEGLRMGVHYCSVDNKNSGQFYQQNKAFKAGGPLSRRYGWLEFDESDYLLKCAKVFGVDVRDVEPWAKGRAQDANQVYVDRSTAMLAFPLSWISDAQACFPQARLVVCQYVAEWNSPSSEPYLRELACMSY